VLFQVLCGYQRSTSSLHVAKSPVDSFTSALNPSESTPFQGNGEVIPPKQCHAKRHSPTSAQMVIQQPSSQEKTAAPACHCPHHRFENKSNHFHELLLFLSSADTEWSRQFKHFTSKCSVNNGCTVVILRGRLEEIKHSLKILHAFLTLRWIILLNLKINAWASFLCSNSTRNKKSLFCFALSEGAKGFVFWGNGLLICFNKGFFKNLELLKAIGAYFLSLHLI